MTNWYLQCGKESDVVLSTRVRLARNLQNIPFVNRYTKQDAEAILNKIKEITPLIGYGLTFIRLKNIDNLTRLSLIEKHLISPEFGLDKNETGAILLNEEENICIMINEEDHIRIQVLSAGLELKNNLNLAIEIDKKLEELLNYAFSDKYGFLTACPTNVGTGLRISVMVHVPALTATGNTKKLLDTIYDLGMNIRGIYGEGSKSQGDIYQISNKRSLGLTEEEIAKSLQAICDKVIEQERLARSYLGKNKLELEDKVYRSFGILKNCRILSSDECKELLSDVKLGCDMGIIKELDDAKISRLTLYTKPANLQKFVGKELEAYARDEERAKVVKQIIKGDD